MHTQVFQYQTGRLDAADAAELGASFHTLQPSAYKDGAFRLRRYSTFRYCRRSGDIRLQANSQFVQGEDLNAFQGNVARTYDDLTAQTVASNGFAAMMRRFAEKADLPEQAHIEVHQMRIVAKNGAQAAESTPEGIHQDGFDRIGVFTVARHNAEGGELYLWQNKDDAEPVAACTQQAGDFCVLNDKALWHSASPVCAADAASQGYWDLFVLTVNRA
nr:2OG-Fe dioxygenase family protein [Conchiformibius kuhniae]